MKNLPVTTLSVLLILFFCLASVKSQSIQNIDLDKDSLSLNQRIPSVDVFIQSALKKSPFMKISDVEAQQILEKIKIEKKSWSDYLSVDGNVRYGLSNQLIISGQTGVSTDYSATTANQQLTYYGGLSLKIPLSNLLNKKNQLKILNNNLNETKCKKEQTELEVTNIVIDEYYKLIRLYQIYQMNINMLQTLKISNMKAQKDIASGLIEINDYLSIITSNGKAEEIYYNAKNDYYAQYRKIQVLTGLNLNSNK